MKKSYSEKKCCSARTTVSIVACLLLLVVVVCILGAVSSGFRNWDTKSWFKSNTAQTDIADVISQHPDELVDKGNNFYEFRNKIYLKVVFNNIPVYLEAEAKQKTFEVSVTKIDESLGAYVSNFDEENNKVLAFIADEHFVMEINNVPTYVHRFSLEDAVEMQMFGWSDTGTGECNIALYTDFNDIDNFLNFKLLSMEPCKVKFTVNYYIVKELPEDFDYSQIFDVPFKADNSETENQDSEVAE